MGIFKLLRKLHFFVRDTLKPFVCLADVDKTI